MDNCWKWKENCLDEPLEDYFGFIYLIRNKINDKIYVGKKQFSFLKKKRIAKTKRTGRKRIEIKSVDSGWKNYWGSSKSLLEDIEIYGRENFEREILFFAKNKTELSYYEIVFQIDKQVLFVPSYNGWISCKIYKNNL